ncbi:MAG: vitamin K epoxide reductase family protein [Candidatus Peregrinibacteria bacterium]
MKKIPNWLIWTFAITAFAGLLDATYLTVAQISGSELNCTIFEGCNEVARSKYSEIFGIPVALFGALFYLTMLILSLLYYDTRSRAVLSIIPPIAAAGFLFTLYLVYLQLFVIHAVCIYCMFSALTTTTLFVLSISLLRSFLLSRQEDQKVD